MNQIKKEKGFKQVACEILDISTRSYSNFSKQNRFIIKLLEKYFTKEDLQEFLETGKIQKQERLNELLEIEKINTTEKAISRLSDIKTQNDTNKDEIKINDTLLEKAQIEASKFGLNINSYIEHLIIQDLKMKNH